MIGRDVNKQSGRYSSISQVLLFVYRQNKAIEKKKLGIGVVPLCM